MPDAPAPVPPVSGRDAPRFATRERHRELGTAFIGQGEDYDRLRPGYPPEAIDAILAGATIPRGSASTPVASSATIGPSAPTAPAAPATDAVDLGAGTGKLTRALAARGLHVTALDPSSSMLATIGRPGPEVGGHTAAAPDPGPGIGRITTLVGTAEETGLPDASADLVTAAQAWHWFDTERACAEILRILRPEGTLALVWNTLDVQVPWVHRYSRIMHAGDVMKEDFSPPIARGLHLLDRAVVRWEDRRPATELVELAMTRSYVIAAAPEGRERVLANLRWYVHEHLGHAPEDVVGIPYRTDVFRFGRD